MSRFSDGTSDGFTDGLTDEELERLVGETLAAEREVPSEWRDAARAAYAWRNVEEELLALSYDSRLDEAVSVRGEGRTLEFSGEGLTLEVEVAAGRVLGRLGGAGGRVVTIERADGGSRSATADESGFFSFDGTDVGPVRFAVDDGGGRRVTEWVVL